MILNYLLTDLYFINNIFFLLLEKFLKDKSRN
jgi:hypothetical protein